MADTAPQLVSLPSLTEGDHLDLPQISAVQDGGNPALACTKFRLSFRRKNGTLGCTLSTDSGEEGAIALTLTDGAAWQIAAQKIPASDHNLTAGKWQWDAEVTLSDGSIRTFMYGELDVRTQYTRAE